MMNLNRLYEILNETTVQLRKGEIAAPDLEKVDFEFLWIGVNRAKVEAYRQELIQLLNTYPRPDRLAGGPSYIEVGAELGDQGAAFQLFALGKVLGLWSIITPTSLGMSGLEAKEMAGQGFIMISGYNAGAEAACDLVEAS
jgi:hypothetical protein